MSEYLIRNLAERAAAHPQIEAAIMTAIRVTLPGVIEGLLREQYSGETLRLYVPKRSRAEKRQRDAAIRDGYTGRNSAALAEQWGVSKRQVVRIAKLQK